MPWEVFDYNVDMIEGPYYWSGKLRGQDYEWMLPAFPPGHFNRSEHDFDPDYPIALRYEQISEDEFWDPWHESPADLRDNPTSAARLARTLIDRHAVDAVIDLHQQMQLDNVRLWVAQYQGAAQERADRISQRIETIGPRRLPRLVATSPPVRTSHQGPVRVFRSRAGRDRGGWMWRRIS